MSLSAFLKSTRLQAGITLGELSERIDQNKPKDMKSLHLSFLSRYERAKTGLSEERLQKILMYGFNKTAKEAKEMISQYLLEKELGNLSDESIRKSVKRVKGESSILSVGDMNLSPSNMIPVYSSVGAGFEPDSATEILHHFPLPPSLHYKSDRLFYAVVRGDSMDGGDEPIKDGDTVLILKDGHLMETGLAYVFWIDGDYTVREYKKIHEQIYQLIPRNPGHDEITVTEEDKERIYPVGKVLGVYRLFA